MKSAGLREVIALTLAIILWTFVRVTRSGVTSQTLAQMQITVPVKPKGVSQRLTPYEFSSDTVKVTVQGDAEAVASLREQQIDAFVDLSGEEASSIYPQVKVIVPGIVKIVSVDPEAINVKQAVITSKQVPVTVHVGGPVAAGRSQGKPNFEPSQVRVSGPEPLVQEVTQVKSHILLTGQTQSTTFELRDLVPLNREGQPVEGRRVKLKVLPSVVVATVPIEAENRSVGVAVSLENVRATQLPGWHTSLEVEPNIITLRVGKDQEEPSCVVTRPEVFSASSKVETREVPVEIPDGFEVIGSRTVKVRAIPTPVNGTVEPTPTPLPGESPTPRPHR